MKVLILQSELGVLRGGGENFTRNLFAAFAERGHRVTAAFVADSRGRYSISLPSSIQPIPIPGWWSRLLGQATLSSMSCYIPRKSGLREKWDWLQERVSWRTIPWHNRRFQQRVERKFASRWGDFDVVYVHSDPILASKVAQYRPTVLRLPGPVSAEFAAMLRSVHAVCANGDAFVQLRTFLGDHVAELPIGLDAKHFCPGHTPVRSALGWGDQHCVVGYVGQLTHLKGVDLLAASFREISRNGVDARLLIVGSGEQERHIRSVLATEFARGIVHIEPGVNYERLPEWYRAMDVMVMPSRYENFSNAVLEAMACGVPFIASNIGGNRILAEGGAGWLFEAKSVSSLSACLRRVIGDRAEMKAQGKVASCFARKYHSWEASAEHLEAIIRSRLGVKG